MEYSLEFGGDGPQDLTITFAGVASPPDFRAMVQDLISDARFHGGMTMLVDLSELDTSGLASEEVQGVADSVAGRDWDTPARAIAIVAPGRSFDHAKLYRAHVGGSKSGREVFRSREDALAWLREAVLSG